MHAELQVSVSAAAVALIAAPCVQVTLQTWFFLSYLMDALAIAANGLVADGLGRGDSAAARRAAMRCIAYAGLTAAAVGVPLAILPHGAAAIFTSSSCELHPSAGPRQHFRSR